MNQSLIFFKNKLMGLGRLEPESWSLIERKAKFADIAAGTYFKALNKGVYFILVCRGPLKEHDQNQFGEHYISRYLVPGSVCVAINPKSKAHFEAIEDASFLMLSETAVFKLSKYKDLHKSFSLLLAEYMEHRELRGVIATTKSGVKRYGRFFELYRQFCEKLYLAEIADFLGVTRGTAGIWRTKYQSKKLSK